MNTLLSASIVALLVAPYILPSGSAADGAVQTCAPSTELTRTILVDFASITDNPNVDRRGLNVEGAEAARVLARPGDAAACSEFDRILAPISSVTWSDGSPKYQIAYYAYGGHYYVVRALSQPEASGTAASGLSFVYVFDAGLEHIGGAMF